MTGDSHATGPEPPLPATPEKGLIARKTPMAIVPESLLPAVAAPPTPPALITNDPATEEICIIPGSGLPTVSALPPPRRRTFRVQICVATLVLCGLVASLFAFAPLTQAAGHDGSPLSALADIFVMPTPEIDFPYRVRPGDTYERIATHFGVQLGGIYELNKLYAGQEAQVGMTILVPTNPHYGVNYQAPMLPIVSAGAGISRNNYIGSCLFCSAGGWTNGASNPCAAAGTQNPITPANFAFLNPDPNSHWVRGFTWDHNGVDISTGQDGTPIVAAQAGVVIFAGWDPYGGGFAVKINHCGGMATAYAHMEKLLVGVGQAVQQGQQIGLQGATGNATGPHLHFMTWWDNVPFDPLCVYSSIDGVAASAHYGGCPSPQNAP
jgi:LysM repeat protein